jgi:hypothetical protein
VLQTAISVAGLIEARALIPARFANLVASVIRALYASHAGSGADR